MASKWNFRNKKGQFRACRLSKLDELYNDPMSVGAPLGDFVEDWRKRDLRDGCPRCKADVEENMSEPDVMQRWGLR